MAAIPERRGPVIGFSLLVWLVALGLAIAVSRGRPRASGVRLVGLSVVYLPLVLLVAAALEPSQGAEQLLVIARGAAAGIADAGRARAATGRWRSPRRLTVLAYAVDVIAGSPLTTLSLLGPNPGLGVRFYGIGNELEALLAVLVVAGTGAGLPGFAPRLSPARAARSPFSRSGLLLRVRLRRRALRRRCRRRDRLPGRRGGRRGGDCRTPAPHGAAGRRRPVRRGCAAGPCRPASPAPTPT